MKESCERAEKKAKTVLRDCWPLKKLECMVSQTPRAPVGADYKNKKDVMSLKII